MGLGVALQSSHEDFAGAVRLLRAPAAGTVRRMCGGAVPNHDGPSPKVEVELLAYLRVALQDAVRLQKFTRP